MKYLCQCDVQKMFDLYKGHRFENGLQVCQQHGYPLQGYLSPHLNGDTGKIDYRQMSNGRTLNLKDHSQVDTRDTRDPAQVGQQYLSKNNGQTRHEDDPIPYEDLP